MNPRQAVALALLVLGSPVESIYLQGGTRDVFSGRSVLILTAIPLPSSKSVEPSRLITAFIPHLSQ
jgi:hypothetical protein